MKKLSLFFLLTMFLLTNLIHVNAQTITTFCGASVGYGGDGGQATAAQMHDPECLVIDASGNAYVIDEDNNIIRMVTPSGIISTFAGTTTPGYTGDGGPATAATFDKPGYIIMDGSGNIFISEQGNHVVRKIDMSSGIISTYAGTGIAGVTGDGGPATAATLNVPTGLAMDPAGNLYIGQRFGGIRKVDPSGTITLLGGLGAAVTDGVPATASLINANYGICLNNANTILYVADIVYNRVRMIDLVGSGHIVTSIAGTGSWSSTGDGGPSTAASLTPFDVKMDSRNNLIISDYYFSRIRKIDPSGIITTIAGTGVFGYSGDGGPALAARLEMPDNLYIGCGDRIYFGSDNYVAPYYIRTFGSFTPPQFTNGSTVNLATCPNTMIDVSSYLEATDPDNGQTLTWTSYISPSHGSISGLPSSGTITLSTLSPSGILYNPAMGYTGSDMFKIIVKDCSGEGDTITVNITITATVPPIGGVLSACAGGGTTTLSDAMPGGTWSSGNPSVATIVGMTGVVIGGTPGTANITYTTPCGNVYTVVTVNALPEPISGTLVICEGQTSTLASSRSGTWSSSNTTVSVGVTSGIVTGIAGGTATITYSLTSTGCSVFETVTVIAMPTASVVTNFSTTPYSFDITTSGSPCGDVTVDYQIHMTGGGDCWRTQSYTFTGGSTSYNLSNSAAATLSIPCSPSFSAAWIIEVDLLSISACGCTWSISGTAQAKGANQHHTATVTPPDFSALTIIPNPNNGTFTVTGPLDNKGVTEKVQIEVLDVMGKAIYTDEALVENDRMGKQIKLGVDIAVGSYSVKISNSHISKRLPLVIDK